MLQARGPDGRGFGASGEGWEKGWCSPPRVAVSASPATMRVSLSARCVFGPRTGRRARKVWSWPGSNRRPRRSACGFAPGRDLLSPLGPTARLLSTGRAAGNHLQPQPSPGRSPQRPHASSSYGGNNAGSSLPRHRSTRETCRKRRSHRQACGERTDRRDGGDSRLEDYPQHPEKNPDRQGCDTQRLNHQTPRTMLMRSGSMLMRV